MKNLLVALMLVILGQRWEALDSHPSLDRCVFDDPTGRTALCKPAPDYYRLVYVIGENVDTGAHRMMCHVVPCYSIQERFTVPVPNTPSKAMSKDEAEKANKELMK